MLFLIGVGMAVVGVAFCLLGRVQLPQGRVLRPKYAQICGTILLAYFPLAFLIQLLIREWEFLYQWLAYFGLAVACLLAVAVLVLRTTQPAGVSRQSAMAVKPGIRPVTTYNPLLVDHAPEHDPADELDSTSITESPDRNTFDLS
jgi:hypothetical protein